MPRETIPTDLQYLAPGYVLLLVRQMEDRPLTNNQLKSLGFSLVLLQFGVHDGKAGFRRCVAYPKPLVSWIHRRKRLKWARGHIYWDLEDWLRVIFTDQSSFGTGQRARIFVSRRSGERHYPNYIIVSISLSIRAGNLLQSGVVFVATRRPI